MKRSAIFLQIVIVVVGVAALGVLLWEPHIEGRNAHATLFEIYFKDPFLAYAYIASIPFFVALYQTFKVLGYAGRHEVFSPATVRAVRTIKHCAMVLIGFIAGGMIIILLSESDDRSGGIFMGILFIVGSTIVATVAAMVERILQNALDLKAENDLLRGW